MLNHNQDGAVSGLLLSLIVTAGLLILVAVFAIWAYGGRESYKNNVDAKIQQAVQIAQNKQQTLDQTNFNEQEKSPYNTYNGPSAYGSIVLKYPKTWSGYLNIDGSSTNTNGSPDVIDAYFNPQTVPSLNDPSTNIALHLQIINQSYAQTVQGFAQAQGISSAAYSLPKLKNVVGVEVSGTLPNAAGNASQQTMVILPDRSDTIELSTAGNQYLSDFNNIILANFSFSP